MFILSYHYYNDQFNVSFCSVATLWLPYKSSFVVWIYKYILNNIHINDHNDEILRKKKKTEYY